MASLAQFMQALRANPAEFQTIAQDGGGNIVARVSDGNIVEQYPEAEVSAYRYPDGFAANWSSDGGGFSVTDADPRPTMDQLRTSYERSRLPGAGISFDQYLRETGAQVDSKGRVDQTVGKDYGFGDEGGFGADLLDIISKAAMFYGGATGLGNLLGGAAQAGLSGATGGVGSVAANAGTSMLDPSLITSPVVPVSTGGVQGVGSGYGIGPPTGMGDLVSSALGGTGFDIPSAITIGTPTGMESLVPSSLGGTGIDFSAGALNAGGTVIPAATGAVVGSGLGNVATMPNPGAPAATASEIAGTTAPAAGATAGTGAAASLLNQLLDTKLTDADTSLIGKLLATGLGGIGASQQANASSDLAKQFMDLGKPYRDSLASLEANPAAYYQSPEVKGALQQGSDALARSLSAKVGNPILNPTALQEMQNYSTNGLLGQLNQRRSFLANAGGLGVGQAAGLGSQAAQSQGGVYNALGAGLGTVFGNQKDYAAELLDILKNRSGSSGMSLV